MLSVKDYCDRYGYKQSSVRKWASSGRLAGAIKDSHQVWQIPEDARPLYVVRKKNDRSIEDNIYDYLNALNKRYYVNEESLHCTKGELQDIQETLLQDGLIAPSTTPCDGKWSTGYRITGKGIDAVNNTKKRFLQFYKCTVEAVIEGVTAAYPGT